MEKLKNIMSKVLNVSEKEINEKISRGNPEAWDSFNHLLLISEIEKEMKIGFTIQEVERIKKFKDLVKVIAKKERQNR